MQCYTLINEKFADQTVKALYLLQKDKPANITPLIWIHDYHLLLMANWVRQVCFSSMLMFDFTNIEKRRKRRV